MLGFLIRMVQLFITKIIGTPTAPTVALSPLTAISLTQGSSFTRTFTASGGTSPYTYSVASGSLPAGLTLNTSTGVLSGTPTVAGAFSFGIRALDALNFPSLIGAFAGTIASSSATLNSALARPALTLVSANTDGSSPVLNVGLDSADYAPGDTLRIFQRNKAGTLINTFTHVITLAEATDTTGGADGRVASLLSSVAAGTWRFTADVLRAAGDYSGLSAVLTEGPDDQEPTLTLPTHTSITSTSASLGFTTDEAGTYFRVLVPAGSAAPSKTQIIAGQNAAGSAAPFSGTGAAVVGANAFPQTGLPSSTAYDVYTVVRDAATIPNVSAPLVDTFTTNAASVGSVAKLTIGTGSTGAGANRSQYMDVGGTGLTWAANNNVGAFCGARSTDAMPAKAHFENVPSTYAVAHYFGITDSGVSLGPSAFPSPGQSSAGVMLKVLAGGGFEISANGSTASSGSFTAVTGDTFSLDYDNSTPTAPVATFKRKSGGTTTTLGSPVTLTSQIPTTPTATVAATDTPAAGSVNFGASAFAITPLTGHTGW